MSAFNEAEFTALGEYEHFIKNKLRVDVPAGFDLDVPTGPLFDFQAACVKWALKRGRAALFADTGLGKTAMQTAWAQAVADHTGGNVIIAAPLCVAQQTVDEAAKFGIVVKYCRADADVEPGITITNYEMLDHFDLESFAGVVLDESSILKSHTSKTREAIVTAFKSTPYKLSCTATPSPNDYMELGNQADFLGVMSASEMLATFFTHDGGDTSKWRLKGHGRTRFWEWMATWSICIRNPADIGFDGARYELPPLNMIEHTVSGGDLLEGQLFAVTAQSLSERRQAKKNSMADRVALAASIANSTDQPVIVWCHMNEESTALTAAIPGAVEVTGSMTIDQKTKNVMAFTHGAARVLVSKASICGFGMNWQHCNVMVFAGMDDSFEKYYQAVRRCHRFGQRRAVDVHIITAETEGAVKANIERKQAQANEMAGEMVAHMRSITRRQIVGATSNTETYNPTMPMTVPAWIIANIEN
ncbi:DEAD/DEAH box helicase [Janthinobacterium sp. UMAB-56]|uniref:helicase-related protein n=1 Tax=Janthinobacterium sp. UMAB-56 TaxID=1365361 RepID=UPI001C58B063|nr:DEAD/DEAH box helicase [Janthinobacterium sp. UMAB-56]